MKRNTLALVLIALLVGCNPTHVTLTRTNIPMRTLVPRPASDVEVRLLTVPDDVIVHEGMLGPLMDVALIEASGGSTSAQIDAMRARAGRFGCEVLLILALPTSTETTIRYGRIGHRHSARASSDTGAKAACMVRQ